MGIRKTAYQIGTAYPHVMGIGRLVEDNREKRIGRHGWVGAV